jgi:hypothetical protein
MTSFGAILASVKRDDAIAAHDAIAHEWPRISYGESFMEK